MKRFISNSPFKILALVLALILWLYVTGELEQGLWWQAERVTLTDVPIKILGLSDKEIEVKMEPTKTNVVLYSQTRDIESIDRDDITLFIDVSNLDAATYELQIQSMTPKDFNISRIEPPSVIITIREGYIVPFAFDNL